MFMSFAGAFATLAKAIRQIMALEQETVGMREKRAALVRHNWLGAKTAGGRGGPPHWMSPALPGFSGRKRGPVAVIASPAEP
jgi:hypothetical protein